MKKTILSLIFIVLVLGLAACGDTGSEPEAVNTITDGDSAASTGNDNGDNGDGEFDIPAGTMLMLGTVMLEETDYAVDSEQASALLPLWKALRSFGESETTAQAEIDAVISQIGEGMTAEQITAIEAMDLTMGDMGVVAETLGVEMGVFGSRFGEMTPEMQETMQAMRESGNFQRPGGDLPGGGPGGGQGPGGGLGGAEMNPEARATAMAERGGARGARSGINSFLLDGIIEFLEAKIQ
jgi:predicted small lipoprotein YifL